jgi:hypothetical protein
MSRRRPLGQILSALFVILFGLLFAFEGSQYRMGTASNMGPGFFPVGVGLLLAALGAMILVEIMVTLEGTEPLRFRPAAMVVAAMICFALLLERFGFAPATFALVILGAFADERPNLKQMAMLALILCAAGAAVFIYGFGVPVQIVRF